MAFDINIAGLTLTRQFKPDPTPELRVLPTAYSPCTGTYNAGPPIMCGIASDFEKDLTSNVADWVTYVSGSPITLAAFTPAPDWILIRLSAYASGIHGPAGVVCDPGHFGGGVDATRGCAELPDWSATNSMTCAGTTLSGIGYTTVSGWVPNPSPSYTGDPTNDASDYLFTYSDALTLDVVWSIISGYGFHSMGTSETQYWAAYGYYGGVSSSTSPLMAVL